MSVATLAFPASIARVLTGRGLTTPEAIDAFLYPSLDHLDSPDAFSQMQMAVDRLLAAVKAEQPVAIYADRDVDGLTGLAILVRTLRTLGGTVVWGGPVKGRGLEREVLERLVQTAKVMILVDCGTGEHDEISWLASQGVDVIVADHHRFGETRPVAFAWIHPEVQRHAGRGTRDAGEGLLNKENLLPRPESRLPRDVASPAGCVMAFKLAQAIWMSFLGDDRERMDYFLFSHLDLVCLGILADRVSLQGDNRILVWHGLRRLAFSRKLGLASLMRFFRLLPRTSPVSVREASWQLIPILNAGGRLGRPELSAELLITEDADAARGCIDELLQLNTRRRAAQDESLASFEKAVLEQCRVDTDLVLVALAEGLEPSVTGLAAQALARKYGRPAFLFVDQGDHAVGSGRGLAGVDLFAWIQAHQDILLKFGGHEGAVGLTLRTVDFATFRSRLITSASQAIAQRLTDETDDVASGVEAVVSLEELDESWWLSLSQLAPFGKGNPMPLFQIEGIESVTPVLRKRSKLPADEFIMKAGGIEVRAAFEKPSPTASGGPPSPYAGRGDGGEGGPWSVIGYPVAVRKTEREFTWMIRKLWRNNG